MKKGLKVIVIAGVGLAATVAAAVILLLRIFSFESATKACYDKGLDLAVRGNFASAKREFSQALADDYPLSAPLESGLTIINDVFAGKIQRKTALYLFKAAVLANKKDFRGALAELDKAVARDARYVVALNARGVVLAMTGAYDKALADFHTAMSVAPGYGKTYLNRASLYSNRGLYEEALADLTRSLALDSRYCPAYYARGSLQLKRGFFVQAGDDFSKVITLSPRDWRAFYRRGIARIGLKRYGEAIDDFNRVLVLNPASVDCYFLKALAYEKALNRREAARQYAFFIRLAPAQQAALIAEARQRLANIE